MDCIQTSRVRVVRSMFRKETVVQKLIEKLYEELSAEKNGKLRINNGLWVDHRESLRSRWNLYKISSGSYAIVTEIKESATRNAESQ